MKVENYKQFTNFKLNLYSGQNIITSKICNVYDPKHIENEKNMKYMIDDPTKLNMNELLKKDDIDFGVNLMAGFQDREFILNNKEEMLSIFNLQERESWEDAVYVAIRLGDSQNHNQGINYYRNCLNKCIFSRGYITTDSPEHEIVKTLMNEYKLELYNNDPGNKIIFGRKFDNIICSGGTFSFWIAFLSGAKNIFYPIGDTKWYGDIFVIESWNGIDCSS